MNWNILHNYMHGTCSEEQMKQLQKWLWQNPANEEFFKTFVESWDEDEPADFEIDARKEWKFFKSHHLNKQTDSNQPESLQTKRQSDRTLSNKAEVTRKGNLIWYFAVPVLIVLTIAVVFVAKQYQPASAQQSKEQVTYRTISTTKGQRTNLRLKDGTKITLNAESSIRIPESYGDTTRAIYLRGEAFFNVTHNDTLPFLVLSNNTFIKDLGTKFNINAYDSTKLKIAVKEGIVSLGKIKNGIYDQEVGKLRKNNLGVFSPSGELSISTINDISLFAGWTRGKLIFSNTPFSEVLNRLERWFNIEGQVTDQALNNRTLTATYDNMPVHEVLDVLSLSLNLSYNRTNDTITFKNKNSTP